MSRPCPSSLDLTRPPDAPVFPGAVAPSGLVLITEAMAIRALPIELARTYEYARTQRMRTIWDARGLLLPYRNRLLAFRLEDGQFPDAQRHGIYEDVIHAPHLGFALIVRGLMRDATRGDARHRLKRHRERTTIPVALIAGLPTPFMFLTEPTAAWPMPPAFVPCACRELGNTGRFCIRCGAKVRRVSGRYLGEGFAAMQRALQALAAEDPTAAGPCGCGAHRFAGDRFCTKCRRGAV
jgi:hypothetical protein